MKRDLHRFYIANQTVQAFPRNRIDVAIKGLSILLDQRVEPVALITHSDRPTFWWHAERHAMARHLPPARAFGRSQAPP